MFRSGSIATSAAVAAVFTHGMVYSAVNLDQPLPISTYQRFFRYLLLAMERFWSHAHGGQPMSHIRDFGQFYAPVVQVACPVIGFALFWILSRHPVGIGFWKPAAMVLLLAIPSQYISRVPGDALPWVEASRTIVILWLMVWSVGAMKIRLPRVAPTAT